MQPQTSLWRRLATWTTRTTIDYRRAPSPVTILRQALESITIPASAIRGRSFLADGRQSTSPLNDLWPAAFFSVCPVPDRFGVYRLERPFAHGRDPGLCVVRPCSKPSLRRDRLVRKFAVFLRRVLTRAYVCQPSSMHTSTWLSGVTC